LLVSAACSSAEILPAPRGPADRYRDGAGRVRGRRGRLIGCGGAPSWLDQVQAARAEVLKLAADGQIRPLIDSVLPLEMAAKAHQRFDDRAAMGKIILKP
jgi:NADPH:quinone reductase-like Zn-dependent oxidoreductase